MESSARHPNRMSLAGWWGVAGICALLLHAIVRLSEHAVEPFSRGMTNGQWLLYALCIVFMAYSEGYKGFQKSFSPRVVAKARSLDADSPMWLRILAPLYCFGLIVAPRRRLIVSWTLLIGIVILVVVVRQLAYPWRPIVDGGVVVGLSWGLLATLLLAFKRPD